MATIPTFVASSIQGAILGADLTVSVPTGTQDGDLMVAYGVCAGGTTIAAHASWTTHPFSFSTQGPLMYRFANSEPANYTFVTGGAGNSMIRIATYRGVKASAPFDDVDGVLGATGDIVLPVTTSLGLSRRVLQMVAKLNGGISFSEPGTSAERWDTPAPNSNYGNAGGDEAVGSGAVGSRTWVPSAGAAGSVGYILVLAPMGHGSASGGSTAGGSASGHFEAEGGVSGGSAASGSASGHRVPEGSASGSSTTTGSASGSNVHEGSASGTSSSSGSASGSAIHSGSAVTGTASASGQASGSSVHSGSVTGSVSTGGSAHGLNGETNAVYGTVTSGGTASGTTLRHGSASGTSSASGSATGSIVRHGSVSGSCTASGTALGRRKSSGTASGGMAASGSCNGSRRPRGNVSGHVVSSGTAFGLRRQNGSVYGHVTTRGIAASVIPAPPGERIYEIRFSNRRISVDYDQRTTVIPAPRRKTGVRP